MLTWTCSQIVLNLSLEDTSKKLNKALKRNLEKQTEIITPETQKTKELNLCIILCFGNIVLSLLNFNFVYL